MKLWKKLSGYLLLVAIAMLNLSVLSVSGAASNTLDFDAFYPINTDSEIWRELASIDEKFEATQVPFEMLEPLSTEDLVQVALRHPLASSIVAHDDPNVGLFGFLEGSNVFKELLRREDASHYLVEALENLTTQDGVMLRRGSPQITDEEATDTLVLSVWLSTDALVGQLSLEERDTLRQLARGGAIVQPFIPDSRAIAASVNTPRGTPVQVFIRGELLTAADVTGINNDRLVSSRTRSGLGTQRHITIAILMHGTQRPQQTGFG